MTTPVGQFVDTTIGRTSTTPFIAIIKNRAPTGNDGINNGLQVTQRWIDTSADNEEWFLLNFISSNGVVQANWIKLGGSSGIVTLTGNSGGPVSPLSGNINVRGDGTSITIVGVPGTHTLTASLVGGGVATQSYIPDTGTNPVVPSASGVLSVRGQTTPNESGIRVTGGVNKLDIAMFSPFSSSSAFAFSGTGGITSVGDIVVSRSQTSGGPQIGLLNTNATPGATSRMVIDTVATGSGSDAYILYGTSGGSSGAWEVGAQGLTSDFVIQSTPLNSSPSMDGTTRLSISQAGVTTINRAYSLPTIVGTANYVLTTDGISAASWQPTGASAFGPVVIRTFTTSGTYTPTVGMISCVIEVVGGGGGGGGLVNNALSTAAGGGGSGGYSRGAFSAATIGASKAVTIGAGGAGGTTAGSDGSTGGTTSVGALIQATGGLGGQGQSAASGSVVTFRSGGSAGIGSLGDVNLSGNAGGSAMFSLNSGPSVATVQFAGYGGASYFGGSPVAVIGEYGVTATNGNNGLSFGSGGGGSIGPGTSGGNGADGYVLITEYL